MIDIPKNLSLKEIQDVFIRQEGRIDSLEAVLPIKRIETIVNTFNTAIPTTSISSDGIRDRVLIIVVQGKSNGNGGLYLNVNGDTTASNYGLHQVSVEDTVLSGSLSNLAFYIGYGLGIDEYLMGFSIISLPKTGVAHKLSFISKVGGPSQVIWLSQQWWAGRSSDAFPSSTIVGPNSATNLITVNIYEATI